MNPISEKILAEERRLMAVAMKNPVIKSGLKRKLAGMIMLLVVGLSLVFFLFFFSEEKSLLFQAFEKRGLVLANNLARNVEIYLTRPLAPEVKILLKNFLDIKEIVYVGLWDREGELAMLTAEPHKTVIPPLSRKEMVTLGETVRTINLAHIGAVSDVLVPIWKVKQNYEVMPSSARFYRGLDNNEILKLLSPNKLSLERIGTVRIGFSQAGIQAELRKKSLIVVAFFLLFLGFGLVILVFLSRVIVDPLQRLAKAMNIVSNEHKDFDENGMPQVQHFRRVGDLDLKVRTRDEIEQLADDFRSMVKKLEDSYARLEIIIADKSRIAQEKTQLAEELQTLNRSLEATIKDRTREIVEKNLRLYELSEELQFQKEDLVRMNEQLENTSQLKSSFLANMSHELRTPLNSIIGFAEILVKDHVTMPAAEMEEYLQIIARSARKMANVVDELLLLAHVRQADVEIQPLAMETIVAEVQQRLGKYGPNRLAEKKKKSGLQAFLEQYQDLMQFVLLGAAIINQ
ncbi:MAG: HAMP domain-containing protein, partial [Chlorobiales bacterium]|nr:HAMP domain-containing protein [Chlorobiales bacterium]